MADFLTWHKLTQTEIDAVDITEGNIFFNTTNKEITVDDDGTRTHYGGTVTVDSALSTTSTNPVQNQVIGNIIGDTDISAIGDGTITGAIDALNTAIGNVETTYTDTLLSTGWTGSVAPFTQTISVTGILSSDNPILDAVLSSTYATGVSQATAWSGIHSATTSSNTITFVFNVKPTIDIPFQAKVVK